MGWARLDDQWHDHPKTVSVGLEGAGLFAMCLTWAYRQRRKSPRPGFVPKEVVARFAGSKAGRLSRRLVEVGSFEPTEGGWMIHDFGDYLPKYDSAKASAAGKLGAESRWGDPDEPPPDDEPPYDPYGKPPSEPPSGSMANGSRIAPSRAPGARLRAGTPYPSTTSRDLGSSVTGVDARELPLLPLRQALEDVKLLVRWDKLDPDTIDRIAWLIDTHGVHALVAAAQRAWQPNNPAAFASAWLGAWESLPLPNAARISVVPPWCGQCESDEHRWIELPDGRAAHCPRCHPSTVRAVTA